MEPAALEAELPGLPFQVNDVICRLAWQLLAVSLGAELPGLPFQVT